LITQNLSVYGQNSDFQNSSKLEEKYSDSKIHPILKNWQNSEDPDKFAQKNNLFHENNTIGAYIYLTSKEFQTSIAPDVKVLSSYGKTVFVLVTSDQLDEFNKLDFVEKITPPDLALPPPMPKTEPEHVQTEEDSLDDYILWIVGGGITIGIVFVLKYKSNKQKNR
jgi:hypothetical protein